MNYNKMDSFIFVIFGGTGDLAYKKIFPAILNLFKDKYLPEKFIILGIGRKEKSDLEYYENILEHLNENFLENNIELLEKIKRKIFYYKLEFSDSLRYRDLFLYVDKLNSKYDLCSNVIFYFATSPKYFEIISDNIGFYTKNKDNGLKKLVIEKPFGMDLESAKYLNEKLRNEFLEKEIFRIDHYLGKDMIQNLMYIRFSNIIFEPLWNSKYIDNVQITIAETAGIEGRGEYYDKSGALRDMVQNHIFQILSLLAMEKPKSFDTEDIRDEKVKVLNLIKPFKKSNLEENLVLGQYTANIENDHAYREEHGVSKNSITETYVELKLFVESERWNGVPFYIRTGKKLNRKQAYVAIQFKKCDELKNWIFENSDPNVLMIKIQPEEGVFLSFNMKKPGSYNNIVPVNADYCQNCMIDYRSMEAYERLIIDIIKGDSTLFARWDEVESSWKFIDQITNCCIDRKIKMMKSYTASTNGPENGEGILKNDGRKWWVY